MQILSEQYEWNCLHAMRFAAGDERLELGRTSPCRQPPRPRIGDSALLSPLWNIPKAYHYASLG